ncbi:hypothetical protein SUDANB15_03905 [Streptomyces sp. enrichment culture]|uniref:hypothetical protein n=1 Tax=Streptomyces griseomycini TaxID=66895 RepID=UPI0034158167
MVSDCLRYLNRGPDDDFPTGLRRRQYPESVEDIAYDVDMTPGQDDALCRAVVRLAA